MKLAFQLLVFYGSLIALSILLSNFKPSTERIEQQEHKQLDKSIIEHLRDKHQIDLQL